MTTNLQGKIREILDEIQMVKHPFRKDFVGLYIPALIQSGSVQFHQTAKFLNSRVKLDSNTKRIQDFYREVSLDYEFVAILLLTLLPKKQKLRICIDRTEWDFGSCQVNILMVLIGYGDFYIPFYWELLDNKSGNSSSAARIGLFEKVLQILPPDRIGLVLGDREFIGHQWLKYLKDKGINFCVRMPKSHKIERLDGQILGVEKIAQDYPNGTYLIDCKVDGVWGNLYIKPLDKGEILFVFGNCQAPYLGKLYKKRWVIETCFQNLKTRGFHLEDTHMKILARISKLIAMVSIAYAFCLSLGIYKDRKIQKIKLKKHGYKTNSFFRVGKDFITDLWRAKNKIDTVLTPIFTIFARFIIINLKLLQPHFLVV
jgi:IS4 transposase